MCGRYALHSNPEVVALLFGLSEVPAYAPRYNIAPSAEVLIIRAREAAAFASHVRWGLVPRWAKDLKVGYRMINAKAENLTSSRAYSPLVGKFRHRCLIVADGFYEFTDPKVPRPQDKRLDKWLFTMTDHPWFCIAGIWRSHPDVGEAFTMLTMNAGEEIAPYHHRQIIPLTRHQWADWLDPSISAKDVLHALPKGSLPVTRIYPPAREPEQSALPL